MTNSDFRIKDLELILALHEVGNMTQVAKQLRMSQPALSKQLHELERRVQTPLFERKNGGMVATGPGRRFIAHATESVQSFRRAVHEAQEAKHTKPDFIRVGSTPFAPLDLIDLMKTIELDSYRDLRVSFTSLYSLQLIDQLKAYALDAVLVTAPPPDAHITSVRVQAGEFRIAMREGHPLAKRESLKLEEIVSYPWVMFVRDIHPHLYDLILRRAQLCAGTPRIHHSVATAEHAISMLTDDQIIAWLKPAGAQRVIGTGCKSIPLIDPEIHAEIHLVTIANNRSGLLSEFVRTFMKRLKEHRQPKQLQLPIEVDGR